MYLSSSALSAAGARLFISPHHSLGFIEIVSKIRDVDVPNRSDSLVYDGGSLLFHIKGVDG